MACLLEAPVPVVRVFIDGGGHQQGGTQWDDNEQWSRYAPENLEKLRRWLIVLAAGEVAATRAAET